MIFRVLEPGLLTTLQAEPRRGVQHFGLSAGGPMDLLSHRAANRILGNAEDAATLEITRFGPRLRVVLDTVIALTGADLGATVDGEPLPLGRPVRLARDGELAFGEPRQGCRTYLAVQHGLSVPKVLGSRGTDLKGRFGGHRGRPLQPGDILYAGGGLDRFPHLELKGDAAFASGSPGGVPHAPDLAAAAVLRLVPGAHLDQLTDEAREALFSQSFNVNPRSDRQGLRLLGPPLPLRAPLELLTEGAAFGTLQMPPDGQPILLMADRQSTGGYPRLGEVYSVDLPRAGQLAPGEAVRFALGHLDEARAAAWAARN